MGACNEPGCVADASDGSTRCISHRDMIDTEVMALGDPPPPTAEDYEDDDLWEDCDRCGGGGCVEWFDASDAWGDDCGEGLENHLIDCPDCKGRGGFKHLQGDRDA